jgi:transcription antitermination factor NusG
MKSWYVVHTKPQKEALLWEQFCLRGVETYYPSIRVHPVNPRARTIKPYFPGYLFIHLDLENACASGFDRIPGAIGLVQVGGEPASVPEKLLSAIQYRVSQINQAGGEVFCDLKPGDTIVIHDGPFSGYEAIFKECLPSMRVKVLLESLQGQNFQVELPVGQIERTKQFSS